MPLTAVAPGLWTYVHRHRFPGGVVMQGRMNVVRLDDGRVLKADVERMLAWDFGRVLPGHGELFEAPDARERTRAVLGWVLA
jgi:glyoxylase-like metal-dependent hydrolase (beta-lactamase superfamily II)